MLRLLSRFSFENRTTRTLLTGGIVAVSVLGLWQGNILFRNPNQDIKITSEGGESTVVQIRAADASVETPNLAGLDVGLDRGELAPDFEVSTVEGERVRLSDFRGKAVFLNFWASWCGPCRAEMPDIQALLNQHSKDGLVVLAVNNGESFGPANGFVEELELDLTAIGLDPGRDVIGKYGIVSMPTSIFIDADGVITEHHRGFASGSQMEGFVRKALGLSEVATGISR